MESPSSSTQKSTTTVRSPLAKFPAEVREAHERFLSTGSHDALDLVVWAVIRDHQPQHLRKSLDEPISDDSSLMADLGFDSLALAEIVFFFEDLYRVTIAQQDLMSITTVGELRAYLRSKFNASQVG